MSHKLCKIIYYKLQSVCKCDFGNITVNCFFVTVEKKSAEMTKIYLFLTNSEQVHRHHIPEANGIFLKQQISLLKKVKAFCPLQKLSGRSHKMFEEIPICLFLFAHGENECSTTKIYAKAHTLQEKLL